MVCFEFIFFYYWILNLRFLLNIQCLGFSLFFLDFQEVIAGRENSFCSLSLFLSLSRSLFPASFQPRPVLLSNLFQAGALSLSRSDCRCCSSHVLASSSRRRRRGPGRRRRRAGARRHRGHDAHRPVSGLAGFFLRRSCSVIYAFS